MAHAFADRFRIEPGTRVNLGRLDPGDVSAFPDRSVAEAQSAKNGTIINELQDCLYAEGRRALLVVLCWQGWNHPARLQGDRSARCYRHGFSPPE